MLTKIKEFLLDEDGDLIQNIIIAVAGVLAAAAITKIVFGTIKDKVTAEGASMGELPP